MQIVTQYLPHEPPMVLIDGMVSRNPPHVTCQFTIGPSLVFLVDGKASPLAMMEVAAQTAAVYLGIHWRTRHIGFLASCRSAEFFASTYEVGDVLLVHAELLGETDRSGSFECVVERRGERTARMQLLVAKPPFDFEVGSGDPSPIQALEAIDADD